MKVGNLLGLIVMTAAMGCDSDPSSPTQPQPPTCTLSGTVTDLVTRRGVPGASVVIDSGPSQASTTTNSSGRIRRPRT